MPSKITEVPVQFDPTPLTTGTVDGWFSFITNEPNLLKVKGIDTVTFLLADYNYPLVSETYMVRKSSTQSDRAKIKAVLVADIMGWHDSIAEPGRGPPPRRHQVRQQLGLNEAEQTLESGPRTSSSSPRTPRPTASSRSPRSWSTPDITTLALGGTNITAQKLFDLSLIQEVYQEHPELKTAPTPG